MMCGWLRNQIRRMQEGGGAVVDLDVVLLAFVGDLYPQLLAPQTSCLSAYTYSGAACNNMTWVTRTPSTRVYRSWNYDLGAILIDYALFTFHR